MRRRRTGLLHRFPGQDSTLNESLASYRIHGANNHFSSDWSAEKSAKAEAGIEMTNAYLNEFLARIGSSEQICLSKNLPYRRGRFYTERKWNGTEAAAIARLILNWPLYTVAERMIFLARFLVKCTGMRLWTATGLRKPAAL